MSADGCRRIVKELSSGNHGLPGLVPAPAAPPRLPLLGGAMLGQGWAMWFHWSFWTTRPQGALDVKDNEPTEAMKLANRTVQSTEMDSTSKTPRSSPTEASGRAIGARRETRDDK